MTEYEAVALATRDAALWVAIAQVSATLAVGTAQCVLIWAGLRFMRRAADARDRLMDAQRREADQRHVETMAALEALIERAVPKGGGA